MDVSITVSGESLLSIVVGFVAAVATIIIASAALMQMRESRRQSAKADLSLHASHLPVLSASTPAIEDTHAYISVANIGPGPALSPRIAAWLSFIPQEGRTHDEVLADADREREAALSTPPQLEGSTDSLGSGDRLERFELRANQELRLTGPANAMVLMHWRITYADVFGAEHTRTGTSLVQGVDRDG